MSASALLEVDGLEAGYGKSQVLFGMAIGVQPGCCSTLLGRNGMGKSTTIKSIMGLLKPARGEVRWKGQPIQGRVPYAIARLGLGLVPEGRQIFPNLTVRENLVATAVKPKDKAASPWTLERVHQLFPRLAERGSNFGNQLSGGEQQMLAIGRALMTNPELLILDEATEGLSPLIRQEIWAALAQIKAEGMAILIVDKNLVPLLGLADRHHIVEKGTVAWTGSSDELRADKAALRRYLSVDGPSPEDAAAPAAAPQAARPIEVGAAGAEPTGGTLLDSLYREHRTITAVLDAASQLLRDAAEPGRPLDVRLFRAILHYFDVFPERWHHPKEERFLFPAIRERTNEADEVLERLTRQHAQGDKALRTLEDKLGQVEKGGATEQAQFLDAARVFIDRYRDHLDIEEQVLMPIARRVLPRSEWARIEEQFRQRPDPLAMESPATLVRRILELAPAPIGFGPARA